MTEEEAKKKWCPMVGRLTKNGADHETCIGSACMMWRDIWKDIPTNADEAAQSMGRVLLVKRAKIGGRCGLAD